MNKRYQRIGALTAARAWKNDRVASEPTSPRSPVATEAVTGERHMATLPARRPDLRDHLPGIEAERQVTDWGRSERVERLMDRTLLDFFYNYWFRVEVEGIEHVPAQGAALLVSNHAGALPPDAPMIAKAVKEE